MFWCKKKSDEVEINEEFDADAAYEATKAEQKAVIERRRKEILADILTSARSNQFSRKFYSDYSYHITFSNYIRQSHMIKEDVVYLEDLGYKVTPEEYSYNTVERMFNPDGTSMKPIMKTVVNYIVSWDK